MIELKPPIDARNCPPLTEVALNRGFARAVLEGLAPGRMWVDNSSSPLAAHALHRYGMSLIWGAGLDRVVAAVAEHLTAGTYRTEDEWLQIDPRWVNLDWDERLCAVPQAADAVPSGPRVQRFTRVNFRFDESEFLARHKHSILPSGWSLRAISQREFDLPGVAVTPCAYWFDFKQFLAHGGGVCAVDGDGRVGAIAFASFRFDDELEIGIETLAPFRGQGLARAVAVALIQRCLADGLEPVWSCRKENTASFLLARQLGFSVVREGPYYRLPVPQTG